MTLSLIERDLEREREQGKNNVIFSAKGASHRLPQFLF